MRRLASWLLAFLALTTASTAWAERRVALVIGNSTYAGFSPLQNPENDARLIAGLLGQAKFDVVELHRNLGGAAMRSALRDFADKAAGSSIAVVYFAGHGIEVGGTNYLVPSDAKLLRDADVDDEAVPVERVLRALEGASRLRLVILDACRDNPFLPRMRRVTSMRSGTRGLAAVEPSVTDTLIAFATRPGALADDGIGNSPYATALGKHLLTPGLDLRIALGMVRDEVLTSTGRRQEPFQTGSLGGGHVSLVPALPAAPPATPAPDAAFLDLIRTLNDRATLERLGANPSTAVRDAARARLAALRAPETLREPVPPTPAPVDAATLLRIEGLTDRDELRKLSGSSSEAVRKAAERRLASLPSPANPVAPAALPATTGAPVVSAAIPTRGTVRLADGLPRGVGAVGFLPDGRVLSAGRLDNTARLWDADTGRLLRTLEAGSLAAISPDGRQFASVAVGGGIQLRDSGTGATQRSLSLQARLAPYRAAYSPDGRSIAAAGERTVEIWNTADGRLLRRLTGFGATVWSVAFSPDGRRLVSGGEDLTVRLWDVQTGKIVRTLGRHGGHVRAVAFSPDGKRVVSGSVDLKLQIADADTGRLERTLDLEYVVVTSLAFSPDSRQIAVGLSNGSIRLVATETGQIVQTLERQRLSGIDSVAFSPDGRRLVSGEEDGAVRLWDLSTGRLAATLFALPESEFAVIFPDGTFKASPDANRYLMVDLGGESRPFDGAYRQAFERR